MSYIYQPHNSTSKRTARLRNLANAMIQHEQLTIPLAQAKSLQPIMDHLITLGKQNTVAARRNALKWLRSNSTNGKDLLANKLFTVLAKRYKDRNGGYTRILKTVNRRGDNALLAIIQFV